MPVRLPACDPCRSTKSACDHTKPVCSRCRERDQAACCTYRDAPFQRHNKRTRLTATTRETSSQSQRSPSPFEGESSITRLAKKSRNYPNPGYLGSSSHITIFGHLAPNSNDAPNDSIAADPGEDWVNDGQVSHGAKLIETFQRSYPVSSCIQLVEAWMTKGVNFALAGDFTESCIRSMGTVFQKLTQGKSTALDTAKNLFGHSCRPLIFDASTTLEQFVENFSLDKTRWETLGLFFAAAALASIDIICFEPLFSSEEQRRRFQKLNMNFTDRCLEACLSLDCLNDLQLVLQYENWVVHSFIDGDQSYHSWRKLGDVASTLFALGYHEQIENGQPTPAFLQEIRKAAFARAYSADKNVSIFLGRPPRILKKYSRMDLIGRLDPYEADYVIDTRWSALCAVLKEEVLDLPREVDYNLRLQKGSLIEAKAEEQWASFPAHLRLEGPLKLSSQSPRQRDLIVSSKLNHLHVLFLLRLALVGRLPEPDPRLIAISVTMLRLVVEAIMLKDHLANSGTSLVWKVAYYGLPASGIICLALLNNSLTNENGQISVAKVFQDLGVLVAGVEAGALVHFEEPNYALLAEATGTIQSLLNRLVSHEITKQPLELPNGNSNASAPSPADDPGQIDWEPWDTRGFQDFEQGFWLNLAEHPFLSGMENEGSHFS